MHVGSLRKAKLPQVVLDVDLEIIKSYTSQPNQIITVDEKTAWILDLDKEVIQRVNIQGDALSIIQEIPSKIIDMALTPYNDILLSAWEQSDVKLLTKSREIQMYFSVSPLLPYGIHVTSENDVIVGLVEYGAKFTLRDQSTRAVVIYGKDKKQKKCYEYDQNKQRLFNFPFRITTNVNNDILVIDRLSDRIGRVVGLKGKEGLRWTYEGNPQVNERKPFDPWGIVTTTMGQIIVSDCDNHALHVLSGEGDILVCKAKTDIGIFYPFPLSIDRRGQLWVGCNKGAQTTDAKLHIVKLLY